MLRTFIPSIALCLLALAAAPAAAQTQNQNQNQQPRSQAQTQPQRAPAPATRAQPQSQQQAPSQPQQSQQASQPAAPDAAKTEGDEESGVQTSQQAKCEAYRKAFDTVIGRVGRNGLSPEFLDRNNAFVAANCAGARDVCPRSPEELRVANIIVAQAVSSTGGTFMPFGCPAQPPK